MTVESVHRPHSSMPKPNIFLDFAKYQPTSTYVLKTWAESEPTGEDIEAARKELIDLVFTKPSISKTIFDATHWAVLLRPLQFLPEFEGEKSAQGFTWFVGHYDWKKVIKAALDASTPDQKYAIYAIPTLGQSQQGSQRHELTYNVFISPETTAPFTHVIQRLPTPELDKTIDEELSFKADPVQIKSLASLNMEWDLITTLDDGVQLKVLTPNKRFRTGIEKMSEDDFLFWYDCLMANFLPVIPYPVKNSKIEGLPLVLIDTVVSTPSIYSRLVNVVSKINEVMGGESPVIKNIIKFWQHSAVDVSEAFTAFVNENGIPEKSALFNNLFFTQHCAAREFIIDEILNGFLKIKRPEDEDIDLFRGTQADIYYEMDFYEKAVKDLKKPEVEGLMRELKGEMEMWFERENLQKIYTEFKAEIEKSMREQIESQGIAEYLKINRQEGENEARNEWLRKYHNKEVSFVLWPTIYECNENAGEERNDILVKVEDEILTHAHCTLPDVKGLVVPKREK